MSDVHEPVGILCNLVASGPAAIWTARKVSCAGCGVLVWLSPATHAQAKACAEANGTVCWPYCLPCLSLGVAADPDSTWMPPNEAVLAEIEQEEPRAAADIRRALRDRGRS